MSHTTNVLYKEAERQLKNMRFSVYCHRTEIDEDDGIYVYDCSGFADYSLELVLPEALDVLPRSGHRPLAQDYYYFIRDQHIKTAGPGGWTRVKQVASLMPGDVIAWLEPPGRDDRNTGHVMVVRQSPQPNPERTDEFLIPVIDATESPHANDKRKDTGRSGLGAGTIGLIVGNTGEPVAYRWRGGLSPHPQHTSIALGHIVPQV